MLINLKEILEIAENRKIAIGAFNTPNIQCLQAVIEAASELEVPVIIQHAQSHESLIPLDMVAPIMVAAAKKAAVPVCVHLDHGEDLEYLRRALDLGFTGIMYDGSTLSFEENTANTKSAVTMAERMGASVEAELGSMGRRESGSGELPEEDDTKIYTDPNQASTFIRKTQIAALACSFGTTHGIYLTKPSLDFNVVEEVRKQADQIPVVMHGGSGVSKEDFRKGIEAGVRKINYFTYMDKAGAAGIRKELDNLSEGTPAFYSSLAVAAKESMKENVKEAMKVFARLE